MPQMVVVGPFQQFNLRYEFGTDPNTLLHLLRGLSNQRCSASNPIYQEGSSRLKFDGSLPTEIDLSPQKRGKLEAFPLFRQEYWRLP